MDIVLFVMFVISAVSKQTFKYGMAVKGSVYNLTRRVLNYNHKLRLYGKKQ